MVVSEILTSAKTAVVITVRKNSVSLWVMLGFGLFLAFLTVYPLVMVFFGSVRSDVPGFPAEFTLDGYRTVFTSSSVYSALWNTLWLSVVRAALAMGLATFFAWIVTRTDTPW